MTLEPAGRIVLHGEVGVGAVVLHPPLPLTAKEAVVALLHRAAVQGELGVDDAHQAAPAGHAHDGAQVAGLHVGEEGLTVTAVLLVAEEHVAAVRGGVGVAEGRHATQDVEAHLLALQLVDHEVFGPPAPVAAHVDDEPLLVAEGAPVLVELADVLVAHGREVQVAQLAVGSLVHGGDIVGHPALIAQVPVALEGLDFEGAGALQGGFAVHGELHLLAPDHL